MQNFLSSAKSLLCMLLCLFGVTAYAQEVVTLDGNEIPVVHTQIVDVDVPEKAAYTADTAVFVVDAIVEALGIDSITQAAQYVVNVTDNSCVENISDGWRSEQGDTLYWGQGERMVCVKISDPASGVIDYIGAIDNKWKEGEQFTAIWGFVANEKAAIVKVVVHFVYNPNAIPDYELPDPLLTIADLEIVGKAEVVGERLYTQGFENSAYEIVLTDIAEKLGIDNEILGYAFPEMIYVDQKVDGKKFGTLQILTETDGWLGNVMSEWDEETEEVCAEYYGSSEIFIQKMAYDSENATVSFVMGQMPGKFEGPAMRYVYLYVVYGTKAYVIKFTVNFVEPEYSGLEEMTKVGGETIEISMPPMDSYTTVGFSVDLETIAGLLGAENAMDIQVQALEENGSLATRSTANNGGWWLTANGAVTGWGSSSAFFIEPLEADVWSDLNIGQYPNVANGGEEYEAKLYYIFGEKYYELIVKLIVTEKEPAVNPDVELKVVATRTYTINQLLSGYTWSDEYAVVPYELLEELIGTTDPHFYGEEKGLTAEDAGFYTDSYTINEKPGFWLSPEGNPTGWSSSPENPSPWGITTIVEPVEEGLTIRCMQFPDLTSVGDVFTGNFYLANTETGEMLQVVIIYNIVGSMEEIEIVGEETIDMLVVSEDEFFYAIDEDKIAELLGFDDKDELECTPCLRALTAKAVYSEASEPSTGLLFNKDGYVMSVDDYTDDYEGTFGVLIQDGKINVYDNEPVPADWKMQTKLCLENEGKRYVFNVTFVSGEIYTGISTLTNSATATKVYDLQGREVVKAQKGVFIQNGKKMVIK